MRDLAKIISPIVEGQIRSFLHDHPEVADAWTGRLSPGKTKVMAVKDSLAKRIVRDLLCDGTVARLRTALVEVVTAVPLGGDVEGATAFLQAGLELSSWARLTPVHPALFYSEEPPVQYDVFVPFVTQHGSGE